MPEKASGHVYEKFDSFATFMSNQPSEIVARQEQRAIQLLSSPTDLDRLEHGRVPVLNALRAELASPEDYEGGFRLTRMAAEEMAVLEERDLPRYLYHRYRYQAYPKRGILDAYPPYVQIEPSSICNFRCTFCYQTNRTFSDKKHGFMGTMGFPLFKDIVDQLQNNVEFISISSRGEPLIAPEIDRMLEYCEGRFLCLKLNTNASVLTEKLAHAILSGGVGTCVFSVDSADAATFARLRVNGDLGRVLENIEMFQDVRAKHFPHSKIITRISGVHVDQKQDIDAMYSSWGSLVDQVTFVRYNPWENVYDNSPNNFKTPCSDLWRRMFLWHDGQANPCDCDYKSTLKVGSVKDSTITDLWRSPSYDKLRRLHSEWGRQGLEPCKRCFFQ